MANTIKLKRGSGSDPSASDLAVGEVALRTDNAKLFTKNDAGNVAQIGGGLADVVDDSTPQLGGDLDVNTNNIIFGDSGGTSDDRLTFGAGTDLSIYHNGTDSAIVNSTGDLYITNNGDDLLLQALDDVVIKTQGGELSIQCFGNGGVELYADSNKRFETTGDGATLTGNLTVSGTVDGRDVATDGTKLDGIASGATNVTNTNQLTNGAGFITATLTNEQVQDIVGGMVSGNTESGITVTYQDSDGTLDFSVASQTDNNFTTTLKNKLDGIASGATNVTNTNQLTNGAGFITSADGGNAATLDSLDSTAFLRSNADDSGSGLLSLSSGVAFGADAKCTAAVSSLSDGSTITVNFTSGIHHSVTLGGNRTFGNPSNDANAVGQSGSIFITQDGTGSRTASFHSDYKFAGGTAPTLSTAANAVDRLDYVIKASGVIHCVVTLDVK